MTAKAYDFKCWELACHFLADVPRATDDDRRQLARDLQQRAEDAISDIEWEADPADIDEPLDSGVPWEGELTAEEQAMVDAAWERHKAAMPK
jgi:hypothetical protein